MSRRPALAELVQALRAEGLLSAGQVERVEAWMEGASTPAPWYLRVMVALGAWLASLLLIGFVGALGGAVGGLAVSGFALLLAATALRRASGNDFLAHACLAMSLAGQALLAYGLAGKVPGQEIEVASLTILGLSIALFFLFPDRSHRVLCLLFATAAALALLYSLELNALVPSLGPLLATALLWLRERGGVLTAAGRGELLRPLEIGLMLSACGCLLLSAVYILPELLGDYRFYPRPWLSTLALTALLLYAVSQAAAGWPAAARRSALAASLLLCLVAWQAPGLPLALLISVLGASRGDRGFVYAGAAFLGVFVGAWFYGIEVSLLAKSAQLVAAGIMVLAARTLLLRQLEASGD